MFLPWEGLTLSSSFLEHVKNSVHSKGSLPSNWVQDENNFFASDHIISGKMNSSINQVSDILKKCLYTLKIITGKALSLTYTEILYLTSYPIAVYCFFFFLLKK